MRNATAVALVLGVVGAVPSSVGCGGGGGSGSSTTETAPPTVISTSPADLATGLEPTAVIRATFSQPMDASTIGAATFTVQEGAEGTVSYDAASRTATWTPTTPLAYSSTYTATIRSGARDLAGHPMLSDFTWRFSTRDRPPSVPIATIDIPGSHLTSLTIYEAGNKVFAADDDSQSLYVIDGISDQVEAVIPGVGGAVFEMAVNEAAGKVYAASDAAENTTDITPGTNLIAVVDVETGEVIERIDPGSHGVRSHFLLANDDVRGKVYVAFFGGVGVIDVETDALTPIPGADFPYPFLEKIGINGVTGEVFLPHVARRRIDIIDGETLGVRFFDLAPTGAAQPLDVAVNEVENKLYCTVVVVPGQGHMGIIIVDVDTGEYRFVGADDLEPLAFNNSSNHLFTGVQAGTRAAVVDGATDAIHYLDLGTAGIGAIGVRTSSDRAYLVNREYTVIVDGSTLTSRKVATGDEARGGLLVPSVAVNQTTGKVYVVNDDAKGIIRVFQD